MLPCLESNLTLRTNITTRICRRVSQMWQRLRVLIPASAIALTMIMQANAQAPTLQEQLAAQYKLVKMGSDTSGYSVVEEGTLLAVQKGGLLGGPYSDTSSIPATKFEGGVVHTPSTAVTKLGGFAMKKL